MLFTTIANCSGGMTRRISSLTRLNTSFAVSIRVPAGGRTWNCICPESTYGKKSRPITGINANEPSATTANVTRVSARFSSDQFSTPLYFS